MRILFWNTNRNKINQYIANVVRDYNIDVLIMAEYEDEKNELGNLLQSYNKPLTEYNTLGCDRIAFWSNYVDVEPGIQDTYYSIQIIGKEYIVCCVHLFTDLHGDRSDERLAIIQQIMQEIKKLEEEINSRKTIIIGDLNEMPYGRGCLNANGFHGLPALKIDDNATRSVNNIEYRKFYNPMWNLLGDFSYPPGTYYLNQAKLNSPMWYMLDQVIISQELLPSFRREDLRIITTCSSGDLMDKSLHPNKKISDHFPIMCEVAEEGKLYG